MPQYGLTSADSSFNDIPNLGLPPFPGPEVKPVMPLARPAPAKSVADAGAGSGAEAGAKIAIKGAAGKETTVVRVENLVEGTSAEDIAAEFQSVGPLVSSKVTITATVTFQNAHDAREAVRKYNGVLADGHRLAVSLVGTPAGAGAGQMGRRPAQNGNGNGVKR